MSSIMSQKGNLVATALAGAWRESPPSVEMSPDDLGEIAPLLLETGAGSLGWWRFRHSELGASTVGEQLRMAYRLHTLQAEVHERQITRVVGLLRSAGVEPLLAKGWAIARLYPESGLRPYGDIDLMVRPEAYSATESTPALGSGPVDLQCPFPELDERPFDELYGRSELVALGDTDVRILGPEDHLRFLCLHQLRHGAWRPLWLCDVGVSLDCLPASFDWGYFLSGQERRSNWVVCVLLIAQQLLGARLDESRIRHMAVELPSWLVPAVLRAWGSGHQGSPRRLAAYLYHPAGVMQAVRQRWPSRIQAGARWRTPSSKLPMPPFQAWDFTVRAIQWFSRLAQARP